ncbi:ATP-binding protein [Massilia putida]|uniref:ATP-binding protein n=1 Tax=Massilia putida TaxID=1141883 RepID=UPI0009529EF1|nr:ATP-binding protein [Massilia putida]
MDDSKRTVTRSRSLRSMLSASICSAILVVGIIGAFVSFQFAFDEAKDLQDDELREIAQLVQLKNRTVVSSEAQPSANDEPEMRIWVIRTFKGGTLVRTPDLMLTLPANLTDGLHTVQSRGESWRLYARTIDSEHGLAVAQRTSARDEIARDSALRTLVPFLIVIPILVLLTAILVRVLLEKVGEVAHQVDQKGNGDFEPLGMTAVPAEIIPFVAATNRLLERVDSAVSKHRQFVASAAHELRSPVTAMTLHLENALGGPEASPALQATLSPIGAGLERMRMVVEQLLSLAGMQAPSVHAPVRFDGRPVVVEAIAEVFPVADAKGVDLGLVVGDELTLLGSEHDFRALARNAIENAVLYTPSGGKVDVRLYPDGDDAVFQVDDTGPGIPPEQLSRVFDPFFRIPGSGQPGSGLGLAIVRAAAARLGGTVTLRNLRSDAASGLAFIYRQPSADC